MPCPGRKNRRHPGDRPIQYRQPRRREGDDAAWRQGAELFQRQMPHQRFAAAWRDQQRRRVSDDAGRPAGRRRCLWHRHHRFVGHRRNADLAMAKKRRPERDADGHAARPVELDTGSPTSSGTKASSDVANATTSEAYTAAFASLVASLTENGVAAPIYTAVSTRCNTSWNADNPIARAQRSLAQDKRVHVAADTDALLAPEDRDDTCHLSESGQRKVATAYARAIRNVRNAP